MSEEDHDINIDLNINVDVTYTELRKLETSLIRILSWVRAYCGNEQVSEMIKKIEALIMAIRSAQMAIRAIEYAEDAATPVGWVWAGVQALSAVIMAVTAVQQVGS